jgi:hypothetical protein
MLKIKNLKLKKVDQKYKKCIKTYSSFQTNQNKGIKVKMIITTKKILIHTYEKR